MTTERDRRKAQMVAAAMRRAEPDAPPAGKTAIRSKPVRITLDLSPELYRQLTRWADTAAIALGKSTNAKQVGKKDVEGVFVVGTDNKVTFRPVKVGIAGEKYFEVLSGLKEGEKIVGGTYQAIRELKDGTLVREPKKDDKKPQVTKS